ncbi:DUF4340 domain-containing protein [candidate division KSB1 bacterium]|nr:DUF4340 domain-containing protein [candidate division KSB1 bacterium]
MKKPLVGVGVLVLLLLVYWLVESRNNVVETNRAWVIEDSAKVTSIRIESTDGLVELAKEGETWRVKKPIDYPANDRSVGQLLGKLKEMNMLALITEKPEKFAEYQVDDSAGVKVRLSDGNKVEEFILGRPGPTGTTTYSRSKDNEVWEIGGNQTSTFKKKPKDWRDKTITDFDANTIQKLVLRSPTETTTLSFVDSTWKLESGATKFDAEKPLVERVTRLLAKMSSVDFADTLKTDAFNHAEFQLSAQLNTGESVDLRMMPTDTTANQYFVRKQGAASDFIIYKSTATALMKKPEDFKQKAEAVAKAK